MSNLSETSRAAAGAPPAVPRRSQATRREATRRGLLEAARAVLAADGYYAMTLATVAARAGVTTGAVQRHFASKAGLLLEVGSWVADEHLASLTSAIAVDPALDLPARMRTGLLAVWHGMDIETVRAVAALNDAAEDDPDLGAALLERGAVVNALIRAHVARSLGMDDQDSPRLQTALTLLTLVLRELTVTSTQRDAADAERFLISTAELIAAGLERHG